MRYIFARMCFFYGVLIGIIGLLLMSGWSLVGTMDQELGICVPFLVGYAATAIVTFPVYRVRSEWKAIFEVNTVRRKAARIAMWISIAILAIFLIVVLAVRITEGPVSSPLILRLIGSFLWLNGLYFIIHWAYRPENIFARSTLILVNNLPLALLSAKYRRNAAKARPPGKSIGDSSTKA